MISARRGLGAAVVPLVLLTAYVFSVQVLIVIWARRVRRRRKRFEDIRRALEESRSSPEPR